MCNMELSMKTNILRLSNVFKNFWETSNTTYGLDPANFFALPGYACVYVQVYEVQIRNPSGYRYAHILEERYS